MTFSRHSHQMNPTTPQISRKSLNFLARKITKLKVQLAILRATNTYTSSQQKQKKYNISENEVPNNPVEAGGADCKLQFSGYFPSVEGFPFFFFLMKPIFLMKLCISALPCWIQGHYKKKKNSCRTSTRVSFTEAAGKLFSLDAMRQMPAFLLAMRQWKLTIATNSVLSGAPVLSYLSILSQE